MNWKLLTIVIVSILYSVTASAQRRPSSVFTQSDYTTDTLKMEGYAYVCDTLKHTLVTLRNIEDHPGREDLCYADGTPLENELALSLHIDAFVITNSIKMHLREIVDDAFSHEQADGLEGDKLNIVFNISSNNGNVTDVYFNYPSFTEYANIPIEVYRNMEVRFKNEICFELTDLGRKLNYCLLSWTQCPSGRVEALPEEETDEDDSETINTNIGTININKGTPTTNRGTMTPIGGFGKGTTTNP